MRLSDSDGGDPQRLSMEAADIGTEENAYSFI
jgi:hypothetical protein